MPRNWESMDGFEAFLNAGGIVESDDSMPDDYRRAVFRFIEQHANSELMGGLGGRDWIQSTPGLRHKMALLARAQDEIGHAHLLYTVAADLGLKSRSQMMDDLFAGRSRFHTMVHGQATSWGDRVAIALLADTATSINHQAIFKNCSYGPFKRALKRIVSEEELHVQLGEDRMGRIAKGTDQQRVMLQQSIDDWWWPCQQLFGPNSTPDDPLRRWHIRSEPNEVLRDRLVQRLVPILHGHGFTVPDPGLRYLEEEQRWDPGPIDWEPPEKTTVDVGPDMTRRVGEAAGNWQRTAWVRRAMDRPQLADASTGGSKG